MIDVNFRKLEAYINLQPYINPDGDSVTVQPGEALECLKLIERRYNSLKVQNRVHQMYLGQTPTINVYYDKTGEAEQGKQS